MTNLRVHGPPPYRVAVVHGGPGAGGEMAPVARELASCCGILEPLQTAASLDGQVDELRAVLEEHGQIPVTLIGYSWGAWLSFILAARAPACVRALILVGSGPFEERRAAAVQETRLSRLSEDERAEYGSLLEVLADPEAASVDAALARLGALVSRTDAYDPLPRQARAPAQVETRGDIFERVWPEAAEMRRSGQLLALARGIRCPVVAIHGDYDPHPAAGVREPLAAALDDFRFILLDRCGHTPWVERQARDAFYQVLREELHEITGATHLLYERDATPNGSRH